MVVLWTQSNRTGSTYSVTILTQRRSVASDLCTNRMLLDMRMNMGPTDRMMRLIAALVMVILFFTGLVVGPLGIALLVVPIVFTATGLTASCPLYLLLGIKTTNP